MKTLHIVYAVPRVRKSFGLLNRVYRRVFNADLYSKYPNFLNWEKPIRAPFSITHNIVNSFKDQYTIRLYSIHDSAVIKLGENDIFIGHHWPDFTTKIKDKNSWTHFDSNQITNKIILNYPNDKRVFLLSPFNHDKDQMSWAIPLFEKTQNYIAICGDYWMNNLIKEFPVFQQCKFHQLNMALDVVQYPFLKVTFNEKRKRKYLYIGRVSEEKNTAMLELIAAKVNNFEGGYIGEGSIKGWKQIAEHASLTPEFVKNLTDEYDVFINTSTYDAQATSILEAMSWGFAIACTPQSGYQHDSIFELSTNDIVQNSKVLDQLQTADEKDLKRMQDVNRELLNSKYSWSTFQKQLINIINK